MVDNQKTIAHEWDLRTFKNDILTKEGQEFEDYFCKIMTLKEPSFLKVDAYGNLGDGATDGYIPHDNKYYQCYGPRSIKKLATQSYTKAKLIEDFENLLKKEKPINEYFFVVNDKFQGIPEPVRAAMDELNEEYKDINLFFIGANSIERIVFEELNEQSKRQIIGFNPIHSLQNNDGKSENTRLIFKNLEELLTKRIEVIEKLNPQFWWYKTNSDIEVYKNVSTIQPLTDNIIYQEIEKYLKNLGKGYELILQNYLNEEEKIIENLSIDINKNIITVFESTKKDYVNHINEYLKRLINNYNAFSNNINDANNDKYLKILDNVYVPVFEQINCIDSNFKTELEKCLIKILNQDNYGSIYVFSSKSFKANEIIDKLDKKYDPPNMLNIYKDDYSKEKIIGLLESHFETISEDKEFIHYPHTEKNHAIFVDINFNNLDKTKLKNLQNRSNLALHFLL